MIRRWVVAKRVGRTGWVKLAPAGSYGPAEEPPKQGEILRPAAKGEGGK